MLATVAAQHDVTAVIGGLTLTDATVTGTVPAVTAGSKSGSFTSSLTTTSFSGIGVDLAHTSLEAACTDHEMSAQVDGERLPATRREAVDACHRAGTWHLLISNRCVSH
ncbi:hypothetical protein [Streptacidiphilus sp. MAP12-16]|uniref:hypothetical protein n=1 Tax=Streptacidiphilus sp. MAP12-16 TaxID=3156300 RepID=UPI0035154205